MWGHKARKCSSRHSILCQTLNHHIAIQQRMYGISGEVWRLCTATSMLRENTDKCKKTQPKKKKQN